MYRGRICEIGTAAEVLAPPHHPYTEMLLASAADDEAVTEPTASATAAAAHRGCVFAARCPHKLGAVCDEQPPPLKELTASHAIALPSRSGAHARGIAKAWARRVIMSAPIYHLIPNAPKPVAPYSHVVEADGWLFVPASSPPTRIMILCRFRRELRRRPAK